MILKRYDVILKTVKFLKSQKKKYCQLNHFQKKKQKKKSTNINKMMM